MFSLQCGEPETMANATTKLLKLQQESGIASGLL
jgi:hypothetical protein